MYEIKFVQYQQVKYWRNCSYVIYKDWLKMEMIEMIGNFEGCILSGVLEWFGYLKVQR